MKSISVLVSLFAIGAASVTSAVPARAGEEPEPATSGLTLEGALVLALENNPTLRAARHRIESAAGRAATARLWSNPELEVSADEVSLEGDGFDRAEILVGLSQTFPFPGRKGLDARIGRAGIRISEAEYRMMRNALIRETKSAYFRVLSADRRETIMRELLEVARSFSETATRRVEAGEASAEQELRAGIELDRAEAQVAAIARETVESRAALTVLLGRQIAAGTRVSGTLAAEADDGLLARAQERMLREHPQRERADAERERAELTLRRERRAALPDVTLGAAVGSNRGTDERLAELRVSLPLPLIDRGQGRTREARADLAEAEAMLSAVEQQLAGDLAAAVARVQALAEQLARYRDRIVPRATRALELVREGYEAGKYGLIDLLDTRRTLAETRLTFEDTLLELNEAQSVLEYLLVANAGSDADPARDRSLPTSN